MAYAFTSKQWTISGEHNFGDFTLLNPVFTAKNLQIVDGNVYLTLEVVENGGVFKHHAHVNYAGATETDVNLLVDAAVAAAFPAATIVE
jgi:hypothetical protein